MPRPHKRNRCKECPGCLAKDCGECRPCKDNTKFGGPGKSHACCIHRLCHVLYPEVDKEGRRIRERRNPTTTPTPKRDTPTPTNGTFEPQAETLKSDYDKPENAEADSAQQSDKVQSETLNTPRPKRKRVEPKRIQDSLDRPQWLHRAKPPSATTLDGTEDLKKRTDETRSKAPSSSSMKFSSSVDLASLDEPAVEVPTPTLEMYARNRIRTEDTPRVRSAEVKRSNIMYGYKIPDAPPENTCAGCLGSRDRELEKDPIVLCDGEGCGREYHLSCCVPSLSDEKEQERWLCQDCCPNGGSTASLIKYLEESDLRKAEFLATSTATDPHAAFLDHLLLQDSMREGKDLTRFPISQLDRGALTDITARSDTVSRTRRGQEQIQPLSPDFYVGKSVRIFSLVGSQYHTGRIVDFRRLVTESTNHAAHNNFEFLVRFPAGIEGRKTCYHHWIVLEEHGTCVGTTLVWAGMPDGSWQPCILWLRTARELIPIQHYLIESEGQIHYRLANESQYEGTGTPVKSNFKVLGLVRPFGYHVFHTLNAKDKMMDLFHESALESFLKDGKTRLQFELAKTEFEECERVRKWRAMKLVNPYYALSSVDAYSLGSLRPSNYGQKTNGFHAALCPTVPCGLDRQKLLKLIQRRCRVEPSKDAGAALTCRIIDHDSDRIRGHEEKQHSTGGAKKNGTVGVSTSI